jgi:hypothetical protein
MISQQDAILHDKENEIPLEQIIWATIEYF